MASHIGRRKFLAALSGAAAWPLAARAQQGERMRRIGVLTTGAGGAADLDAMARVAAFQQGLQQLGWTDGRNVRIDYRWYAGNADAARKYAAELVALAPDIVLASGTLGVTATINRPVPIVFTLVADPVGAGFVNSLAQPGGNATGFMLYEYSLSGRWLELLKQIAPRMTRAAVLRDQTNAAGIAQFAAIQALGPHSGCR
jgi:putative ABC transport system substrate-binding protein